MLTGLKRRVSASAALAAVIFLSVVAAAFGYAFEEYYGNVELCGTGCYIQSGGAHTFTYNSGSHTDTGFPYLACQLFNHEGENVVENQSGSCNVSRGNNGHYVWARVYNESGGGEDKVEGWAHTN